MQVASFRARTELTEREILSRLRSALPEDIAANDLTLAAPRFHARLSCVGKTYIYRVQNSEVQNVFDRGALGESLAGTKDRLLGDGMTRAAWSAGKGFINGEEAGSTAADGGGNRRGSSRC